MELFKGQIKTLI